MPPSILPLSREWTSFPRSNVIDLESQHRYTASGRQYSHEYSDGIPKIKAGHKSMRYRLQTLLFKLVNPDLKTQIQLDQLIIISIQIHHISRIIGNRAGAELVMFNRTKK